MQTRGSQATELPYQQMVTDMAERWREKYGLPGVWCAYVRNGKVAAMTAVGFKNVETKTPVGIDDYLNVGSVSKVITGSLLAQFVANGTITYETTVGEVFPELAQKHPGSLMLRSTLGQLEAHVAGLTKQTPVDYNDEPDGVKWRYKQVVTAVASPHLVEPGTVFEYNNAGPIIGTAMVERLSRTSWESWYYGAEGKAIGLHEPRMLDSAAPTPAQEVFRHMMRGSVPTINRALQGNSLRFRVSGNCQLTLQDLARFLVFTVNNSARIPGSVYRRLTTPHEGSRMSDWGGSVTPTGRYITPG